jgi:hypothetical protein
MIGSHRAMFHPSGSNLGYGCCCRNTTDCSCHYGVRSISSYSYDYGYAHGIGIGSGKW